MKFTTHNDEGFEWQGGCLQDTIDASYSDLKKVFGQPHDSDGYKVDAEWDVLFEDGTYVSIYNYKTGKNYNGASGTPKTKIRDWHIGGSGGEHGVNLVLKALGQKS